MLNVIAEKEAFLYKLLGDYNHSHDHSGVKGGRVARRLADLSEIGLTNERGSKRFGFSAEERKAKELVKKGMKEAGLIVSEDGAGNVFGFEGKQEKPVIMSGSHVDSVPNGGHFDEPSDGRRNKPRRTDQA